MTKREALATTVYFMPWIRSHKDTCFEAKETATTVNDSSFEPHQLPSLRKASCDEGLSFKIPDGSGHTTPFDGMHVSNLTAYVAVMYRNKGWAMINIKDWDSRTVDRVNFEYAKQISTTWFNI